MQKNRVQVIFINLGEEGTSLFVGEAGSKYRYDLPKEDVFKQSQSRYTAETDIEEAAYAEDFIDDISDIMEDAILGLDNDDILLDESEIADIENSMTGLIDGYIE